MTTKADILKNLSEEQRDVVINYNGRTNLEAIPGSGKTFTMVARCQYMIKDGVKPSRILVFTFTKKAAEELYNRLHDTIGSDADKMTISTYHSFCGKLLRLFPEYTGRTRNFSIFDEDDKKQVLKKIIARGWTNLPREYKEIVNYISNFKKDNLSPSEAMIHRTETSYEKTCAKIYKAYEEEIRKQNAFDFDDLTYFAYRISKMNLEVHKYITERYDYVLSDENQDANKQNMDFILTLGSKNNNIFVVGDTDQSIYGFRGADVQYVMDIYKVKDFTTKFLSTNYRSTKTIVNAANSLITNNKARIKKDSKTINSMGDPVNIIACEDNMMEADYIATTIKQIKKQNKNLKYEDFAILCRLQAQTRILEEVFLRNRIPFKLKGVIPFFHRSEIKDLLAYLKIAYNPQDLTAFERVANIPKRNIGAASLEKLLLSIKSINDIIDPTGPVKKLALKRKTKIGLENFIKVIQTLKNMVDQNAKVPEMLIYLKNAINYEDYLKETSKILGSDNEKINNIEELIRLSYSYVDLEDFLNNAVLGDNTTSTNEKGEVTKDVDCVNIMTMHGAKGLEFDTVFLYGCSDNNNPFRLAHNSKYDIEEERRLFYVAMTRAKKSLHITYPERATSREGKIYNCYCSRFIDEISKEYCSFSRFPHKAISSL